MSCGTASFPPYNHRSPSLTFLSLLHLLPSPLYTFLPPYLSVADLEGVHLMHLMHVIETNLAAQHQSLMTASQSLHCLSSIAESQSTLNPPSEISRSVPAYPSLPSCFLLSSPPPFPLAFFSPLLPLSLLLSSLLSLPPAIM